MSRGQYLWACAVALALTGAMSAWGAAALPEQIPVHWGWDGTADGFGSKWPSLFLFPSVIVFFALMGLALPWLSPKQFSIESFATTYYYIMSLLLAYFALLNGLILAAQSGARFDMTQAIMGAMFLLFVPLGNSLGKVQRNFYVGVKTPWTLASDRVWNDTHRLAAWCFFGCGVVGVVGVLLGAPAWLSIGWVVLCSATPAVFSLVHYKRLESRGQL